MAEAKALAIELIREKILSYVQDPKDLKNLSLLNSVWNYQAQKYLEERTNCILTNNQLAPFVDNGWSKKNIWVAFWYQLYNDPLHQEVNADEDVEKLEKLGPYIKHLFLQSDESTTATQFFKILTSCRQATEIRLYFEDWNFNEQLAELTELFQTTPLSFPNLKKLSIKGHMRADGWEFCTQFLIPIIPACCNELKVSGLSSFIKPFLNTMVQIPGKLEQFTEINTLIKEMDDEIWEILTEMDLPLLKVVTLYIEGDDVGKAQIFLGKYANQLRKLRIHSHLGEKEFTIPAMANLEKLKIHWRQENMGDKMPKITGTESGDCAYPKLTKLKVHTDDPSLLLEYFWDVSTRGGLSEQLTKVVPKLFIFSTEVFLKWYKSKQERKLKELIEKMFPNATCNINYLQFRYPKDDLQRILTPKYKQRFQRFVKAFRRICKF